MTRNKALPPALLCDLGGTYVRFAWADQDWFADVHVHPNVAKNQDDVWRAKVSDYKGTQNHPLFEALEAAIGQLKPNLKKEQLKGMALRLSLPCDIDGGIHNDLFQFENLPDAWSFRRSALKEAFGFSSVRVLNDAEAAFYAIPKIREGGTHFFEIAHPGDLHVLSRIVLLGPGTGLGAVGGYFEPAQGGGPNDGFYVPVPTEFGSNPMHFGYDDEYADDLRSWFSDGSIKTVAEIGALASGLSKKVEEFASDELHRWEYLISGGGLLRICHLIELSNSNKHPDSRIDGQISAMTQAGRRLNINDGVSIIRLAKRQVAGVERRAVEIFCYLLGRAAADLMRTFSAWSGLYLTGPLVAELGADGLREFGFIKSLHADTRKDGFPKACPVAVIKHNYPELVGLSRFTNDTF